MNKSLGTKKSILRKGIPRVVYKNYILYINDNIFVIPPHKLSRYLKRESEKKKNGAFQRQFNTWGKSSANNSIFGRF